MTSKDVLQTVADVLRARGLKGWLVGGTVRDRELGRYSPDLDLVVTGDAAGVAAEVAGRIGASWFALSERHGAFRIMAQEGHIDVAAVRGGGIIEDLRHRDFTVNAMAVPVEGGKVVDPFAGLADLRACRLRAVSDCIFVDDPLRLLRACRLSHVLGLRLDSSLVEAIRSQASELPRAAPERVAGEVVLTLAAGQAGDAARLWNDLGLLAVILPEVLEGGRLGFTLALLDRLEGILEDPRSWCPEASELIEKRLVEPVDGAVGRLAALRLAGLLSCATARQAAAAGSRLRFSGRMISLLMTTARMREYWEAELGGDPTSVRARGWDARGPQGGGAYGDSACDDGERDGRESDGWGRRAAAPGDVALSVDARDLRDDSSRTTCRTGPGREAVLFLWRAKPWEPEAILLLAAAEQAMAGVRPSVAAGDEGAAAFSEEPARRVQPAERARRLMVAWAERVVSDPPRLPFDGVLLMKELGLRPGPQVGCALSAARLAWEAGEVTTAEQAMAVAREVLRSG